MEWYIIRFIYFGITKFSNFVIEIFHAEQIFSLNIPTNVGDINNIPTLPDLNQNNEEGTK